MELVVGMRSTRSREFDFVENYAQVMLRMDIFSKWLSSAVRTLNFRKLCSGSTFCTLLDGKMSEIVRRVVWTKFCTTYESRLTISWIQIDLNETKIPCEKHTPSPQAKHKKIKLVFCWIRMWEFNWRDTAMGAALLRFIRSTTHSATLKIPMNFRCVCVVVVSTDCCAMSDTECWCELEEHIGHGQVT